uniref:Uncharacterized protein n=1 Tax=Siphoviridae sp. ct3pR10 TaxID=2826284 RepID=A0A8S5LWT4_9CAUD|nr:MAG TPA: hypothetical protein [Siphoviridae sp. ct3pR10]DAO58608.1 MAG TPA: hypothetical protein [Caudoviricetes sp.]
MSCDFRGISLRLWMRLLRLCRDYETLLASPLRSLAGFHKKREKNGWKSCEKSGASFGAGPALGSRRKPATGRKNREGCSTAGTWKAAQMGAIAAWAWKYTQVYVYKGARKTVPGYFMPR